MQAENDPERLEEGPAEAENSAPDASCNGASESDAENSELLEPGINLLEALMTAQKEAAEYRDGWQRERADYSNFRKRSERQQAETLQQATFTLFRQLLPIIDDLERAIASIPADFKGEAWHDGLTLIQRKAEKFLADNDIETLDPIGNEFDPNIHEAIGIEETDAFASNIVTETLQKGYVRQGRILRPALVRVAK